MSRRATPPPRQLAEFASADALRAAVHRLAGGGFHDVLTYTPYEVDGLPKLLGERRSRLGWAAVCGGIGGLLLAYLAEWWSNAGAYPGDIGGRPMPPNVAFVPVMAEATILGASVTIFVALFFRLRLPRLWEPVDEVPGFERATVDRFWISVGTGGANDPATLASIWQQCDALSVHTVMPR